MTVEVLPCCCAVSPCPCFQFTGGYRVTWSGIVSHSPVGCACLLATNVPPDYSGPAFEVYTLRNTLTSGVPAKDFSWRQPTTGNPAPCQLDPVGPFVVVYGSGISADYFMVGLGGYCDGPYPLDLSFLALSFSANIALIPYRPSISQKWRVVVTAQPFQLIYESDSTNCDPTGFQLISSQIFQDAGVLPPYSVSCNGSATQAIVASTLIAEGSVSVVRI